MSNPMLRLLILALCAIHLHWWPFGLINAERLPCRNGRENFVEASSPNINLPVRIHFLRGLLYQSEGQNVPACFNGRPTVLMPGVAKLTEGEMTVPPNNYDLLKSGSMRMTVRSPNFEKPLCENGSSQYLALPDAFCTFPLCNLIGADLCELLQQPGTHSIRELEQRLHFNSTLVLPDPPSILGISLLDLFAGEFSFVFALETGGSTIMELHIPSNEPYLQLGLEEEEEE